MGRSGDKRRAEACGLTIEEDSPSLAGRGYAANPSALPMKPPCPRRMHAAKVSHGACLRRPANEPALAPTKTGLRPEPPRTFASLHHDGGALDWEQEANEMTGTTTSAPSRDLRARGDVWNRPAIAMVTIVTASTLVALLAPDMVTGSNHEHLPLAALTVWPWTAAAVGYVFMAGRRKDSRDLVLGVTFVWAVVVALALAVPTMVTGTDPTRIPLAALLAPPSVPSRPAFWRSPTRAARRGQRETHYRGLGQ